MYSRNRKYTQSYRYHIIQFATPETYDLFLIMFMNLNKFIKSAKNVTVY